ncbi:DUF262 domain-containing protein [Pontibacter kalidii]|uniref:DUF262 domain-containing protein n=1 Tax=Pontibacter kalidii TaxID=2592049 RepID=UPI002251CA19|nr:DUF262 domain-containing protein [Pontibacter kalidii]
MNYTTLEWSVNDLIRLYEDEKLNLSPSYQRNDIWTLQAKKRLIDSIKIGYPLPAFFLHKQDNEVYDMVDGQQRTRTLIGYVKKLYPDLNKEYFDEQNPKEILDYKISVVVIGKSDDDTIEDFYYRVNNYGSKLNRQEKLKAQKANSIFLELVESLAESQDFNSLNLFSDAATERMIDVDFISELVAQIKYDITDKKKYADKLYDVVETREEANSLKNDFFELLRIVQKFNNIYPINKTRYKQKNDFYTLFGFLKRVKDMDYEELVTFYKILVVIGPDILPSNDDCIALQEYAFNCVSQSNSSEARGARLAFFEELLTNNSETLNETQEEILDFYDLDETDSLHVQDYLTINPTSINNKRKAPIVF